MKELVRLNVLDHLIEMVVFLLSEQAGGTLNAEPDEQAEQNGGP